MRNKRGYWTIEKAFIMAKNFNNRSAFFRKESGAYMFLKRNGLLEEACKDMENIIEETTEGTVEIPTIDYNNFDEVLNFVNSNVYCYKGEIWKPYQPVPYFEVSNMGRVRTKTHIKLIKYTDGRTIERKIFGKIIKQAEHLQGTRYLSPNARLDGKKIITKTHRLIMRCFCGESKSFVDHINGIRYDNRLNNLRYVTAKENANNPSTKHYGGKGYNRNGYFKNYTCHEDEIFVPFKNGYKISNYGTILDENHGEYTYGYKDGYGYKKFAGKTIHSIVAEKFVPNENNGVIIDHIDGNKLNNHFKNLRWVSRPENANNPNTKKGTKEVYQYSLNGVLIKKFASLSSVMKDGFDYRLVSSVCLGKRKTHKGYMWRYEPIKT